MHNKRILLVGGFHKADALASSLIKKGYEVTVINDNYNHCTRLAENKDITVVNGDGTKLFVLEDANAFNSDIVIALTQKDDDNLVICQLCKKRFSIKKSVALVNDPKKIDFFHKMGIDSVVCAINAVTNIIEQETFEDEIEAIIPSKEGNENEKQKV